MFEAEQKFRLAHPEAFLKTVSELGLCWQKKVVEVDTYFQHPSRDFVKTDEALRVRRHLTFLRARAGATPDEISDVNPAAVPDEISDAPARVEAECLMTFKGPKLDRETKIRKELELPLGVKSELVPSLFPGVSLRPSVIRFCGAQGRAGASASVGSDVSVESDASVNSDASSGSDVSVGPNSPQALWELLERLPELSVCAQWSEMLTLLGFRAVRNVCKVRSKAYWNWDGARVEFSFDQVSPIGSFAELEFLAEDESAIPLAKKRLLSLSEFLCLTDVEPRSYLALIMNEE